MFLLDKYLAPGNFWREIGVSDANFNESVTM
jgi:hypothetical protein